jgi:hypothetical protein
MKRAILQYAHAQKMLLAGSYCTYDGKIPTAILRTYSIAMR